MYRYSADSCHVTKTAIIISCCQGNACLIFMKQVKYDSADGVINSLEMKGGDDAFL